ncbi:Metal-dependent hydrolase, beta-lactamase superfamily II [Paenibacillus sp. 1_12]|uniref:ComEC/Rec2 family competence protein n=1 Tax=Paenibacillus sp. 1_12 TaxID=1566278 RepID=UPI0008EC225C|nr:ComEC/Rec2 family competence protein [Paenibacillus sp. 1_12]SFK75286.1 Metal-dependent hydrolase, beta-lactamase superfamily II [Paenibacillus sp. 1_12]
MAQWKVWMMGLVLLAMTGCSIMTMDTESAGATTILRADGKLQVLFLDVGQGGSQLLISPSGKTMLIDAGNNDKEQMMLDYLQQYQIKKLDIVIGTHPDADHIGGLDKVIDHTIVDSIYMPKISSNTRTFESLLESISNKKLKVQTAKAGLSLDWDKAVQVEMIGPAAVYDNANNMSAVVKITYGTTSFLLTGDAESASEKDMIKSGVDLSATVLGVGHHGSKTSTSLSFLNKVNPQYAIIQSGKDNNYGHPDETILSRLKKAGAVVYRNDLQGTVSLVSDGTNVTISTERKGK